MTSGLQLQLVTPRCARVARWIGWSLLTLAIGRYLLALLLILARPWRSIAG